MAEIGYRCEGKRGARKDEVWGLPVTKRKQSGAYWGTGAAKVGRGMGIEFFQAVGQHVGGRGGTQVPVLEFSGREL